MSFRTKLSLSFASILILTIIVAFTSIYGMQRALYHQKELYITTQTLEKRFQKIAKKQIEYTLTGEVSHFHELERWVRLTRENLLTLVEQSDHSEARQTFEHLIDALNRYEHQVSNHVRDRIALETMKSRLLHESNRLMFNADAVEKLGESAIGFFRIFNEILVETNKFMVDEIRSSVSMVLHKIEQMLDLSARIQHQNIGRTIQLYAFRIEKITKAYQSVFRDYVKLHQQYEASHGEMETTFARLEKELETYIHTAAEKEKELVGLLQRLVVGVAVLAIVMGIFAMLMLIRRFTGPINDLTRSAEKILAGDYSSQVEVKSKDEIARLGLSFNQMAATLQDSFQRLARHKDHLEDLVRERTQEIKTEMIRHEATQKALEKERNRAFSYFEIAGSILLVINPDGTIARVNKAGRRLLGYSRKELVGKNWYDLCVPDDERTQIVQVFFKMMAGNIDPFEFRESTIISRSGEIRTIAWHNSLLKDEDGNILALLSSGEDTTEATRLKNEQLRLQDQLSQSRKMEAIGTLAGGIAHDFNNILYPIIGYTEMAIADLPKGSPIRSNLKSVFKGALRAKELIRQILTFSRKKSLSKKPLEVQPVIKEALKLLRSSIPTNIVIHNEIDESARPIMGDPTQVYEIIMNLCTNAYHAMEKEGGQITVRLYEKEITAPLVTEHQQLKPDIYIIIEVEDTGPGISEEIRNQVFEPYFTTKSTGKGSGLGLAVTHGIVSGYGGAIVLEDAAEQGMVFKIYLPVIHNDLYSDPFEKEFEKSYGTERVLFVDDEQPIVTLCTHALENLGFKVDGQANSNTALKTFQARPDDYDILITDMTMPDMLGTELIAKARSIRPALPVILCTGFSDLIDEKKARSLKIEGYLKKPVMIDELSFTIRQIIDNSR